MTAKKVSGEAVKPFRRAPENSHISLMCTLGEDVRTKTWQKSQGQEWLATIGAVAESAEGDRLLREIKALHQHFGVPLYGDRDTTPKAPDRR